MKNILVISAFLAISGQTYASDNSSVLIKACQELKRQSDRNKCLEEAVKKMEGPQTKQGKIPELKKASIVSAPKFQKVPEEEWRQSITTSTSEFDSSVSYSAPVKNEGPAFYGVPEYSWSLTGSVNKKTGEHSFMIPFTDLYIGSGWKFWSYADTDQAESLVLVKGDRKVSSCSGRTGCIYRETIGIILPHSFVISAANEGRNIKLRSTNGDDYVLSIQTTEALRLLSSMEHCKTSAC